MSKSILRSAAAIIAGLAVAMVLIVMVEAVTIRFHPFSAGADTTDQDVVAAHVAIFPAWVLAVAAVGWATAVFVSAWIATRLGTARHPAHGIAIAVLLIAAAAFNIFLLPYPIWFVVANLILLPLSAFWGVKMGRGSQAN